MKKCKTIRNWAEMIPDLLSMISCRVDLFRDFVAFRGVCTSWRKVATNIQKNCLDQPPLLMLAEKSGDGVHRKFYCLTDQKVHTVFLPEAFGKRCVETKGWLVMVDRITLNIELFHPFSRVRGPLPNRTTFYHPPDPKFYNIIHKAVLSTSPSFYPENYTLVVIYGVERLCKGRLAFWRPGNQTWRHLLTTQTEFQDVLFYKDQFYAVDMNGRVYVLEFDSDGSGGVVKLYATPDPLFTYARCYLVQSNGALLLVLGAVYLPIKLLPVYYTDGFEVYEIDTSLSEYKKIDDLGSRSLFVGHNTSSSVDTSKFPAIEPNCIYYTDECTASFMNLLLRAGGGDDMGIYNLSDGKTKRHYKDQSLGFTCPAIWFTPSF